ncbi:hypothetical protein PsYK624_131400 [Phanerochaete sordida]|uniref:Uncharacterized protein n=1 Tax=Phanerochaete sordida TaxID=48140 RepID=A0A9P3GLG1_9APHY|nr:hypothetical protein PsYK624_131400 [Phanerochaete sordida]
MAPLDSHFVPFMTRIGTRAFELKLSAGPFAGDIKHSAAVGHVVFDAADPGALSVVGHKLPMKPRLSQRRCRSSDSSGPPPAAWSSRWACTSSTTHSSTGRARSGSRSRSACTRRSWTARPRSSRSAPSSSTPSRSSLRRASGTPSSASCARAPSRGSPPRRNGSRGSRAKLRDSFRRL